MDIILRFTNLDVELQEPLKELEPFLHFSQSEDQTEGLEVQLEKTQEGLQVVYTKDVASLAYQLKTEFFRGLGLLVEAIQEGKDARITEQPAFTSLTYMQDNSRNAVSSIPAVKKLIRQLSLMGYHSLMLYTEDTFEIENYPYFGYQRGRFSTEELKELVAYGESFGVQLIPCIQTLAHLNAIFQWNEFHDIRDVGDILLCNHPKTYELIEAMIRTCAEYFVSRRINIGMDEAEMLGLGRYLKQNGYTQPADIMSKHLKKVLEICDKYGMKAMMWSDMFFKMLPNNTDYYSLTADITDQIKDKIPSNVELVYWDYYSRDKAKYDSMLERHKLLSDQICFAGGAWKWQGFAPLLQHSLKISRLALQSCKEHGIKEIIVTGWGDNGAETSNFTVGPVLQLYAEICYTGSGEEQFIRKRLQTCTHMNYQDYLELDSLNLTPDNPSPGRISVGPAKYIFYQDVLQGLYDKHIDEETYPEHFRRCYATLSQIAEKENEYSYLFDTLAKLAHVLELKCDMGIRLKRAYDSKDHGELERIAESECRELLDRIEIFQKALHKQWHLENKPFGFDVQDIRIGGLKERLRAVSRAVEPYLQGRICRIEELEQKRLLLDKRENPGYRTLPLYHNEWKTMITASVL